MSASVKPGASGSDLGPSRGSELSPNISLEEYLRAATARPQAEKPALVVEGGGMRGVYSIAALAVLEERGLRDAFSVVVGSSAGALHGAYFLSRQAREGVSIYIDELSSKEFINLWRLGRIVDIDFLVDVAMQQRHPFDIDAMREAPGQLLVVVTDVDKAAPRTVRIDSQPLAHVYDVLRATAALPGLYGRVVEVDDWRGVDGGISRQVPLPEAWEAGARTAVVVLTKEKGYRRAARRVGARTLIRGVSRRLPPQLIEHLISEDTTYNDTMDELDREAQGSPRRTWTLRPSDPDRMVTLVNNRRTKLVEAAELAEEDMGRLLAAPATRGLSMFVTAS